MEVKEIFADDIGRISFVGGMIRFDLVSLQPADGGEGEHKVVKRMIMPLNGFFDMFSASQELINKLVDAGLLKKNEPASDKPAAKSAGKAPRKTARKSKKSEPVEGTLL